MLSVESVQSVFWFIHDTDVTVFVRADNKWWIRHG